jgi:RNA polymerase sigma-70 factor, ECF subfamily
MVSGAAGTSTPAATDSTEQFLTAATTGDLDGLLAILAPDVTWTTDSGGKVTAVRELLLTGARQVAATTLAVFRTAQRMPDVRIEPVNCNNQPAMAIYRGDRIEAVFLLEIADGEITNGYGIRNRDRLAALAITRTITRNDTQAQ